MFPVDPMVGYLQQHHGLNQEGEWLTPGVGFWIEKRAFISSLSLCRPSSGSSVQPWPVQPNLLPGIWWRETGVEEETGTFTGVSRTDCSFSYSFVLLLAGKTASFGTRSGTGIQVSNLPLNHVYCLVHQYLFALTLIPFHQEWWRQSGKLASPFLDYSPCVRMRGVLPLVSGLCGRRWSIGALNTLSVIGTPFYLMGYVPGRVLHNPSLPSLEPSERKATIF